MPVSGFLFKKITFIARRCAAAGNQFDFNRKNSIGFVAATVETKLPPTVIGGFDNVLQFGGFRLVVYCKLKSPADFGQLTVNAEPLNEINKFVLTFTTWDTPVVLTVKSAESANDVPPSAETVPKRVLTIKFAESANDVPPIAAGDPNTVLTIKLAESACAAPPIAKGVPNSVLT